MKSRINESNGTRNDGSERNELPSANKCVEENKTKDAELGLENILPESVLCVLVSSSGGGNTDPWKEQLSTEEFEDLKAQSIPHSHSIEEVMSELFSMEWKENFNTGNALISAITEYAYSELGVALLPFDQFLWGPAVNIGSKERVKIPLLSSWWIFSKLKELKTAGEKFCLNSLASHSGVKVQKITQISSWTIRLLLSKPFLNKEKKHSDFSFTDHGYCKASELIYCTVTGSEN